MERNTPQFPRTPSVTDRPAADMTGQGRLVFQITTASGAIPLEGAEIILRKFRSSSDGNGGEVVAAVHFRAVEAQCHRTCEQDHDDDHHDIPFFRPPIRR